MAGDGWREWAKPILDALGPFPGAALNVDAVPSRRVQKNRQLLAVCGGYTLDEDAECDFKCRASAKHLDALIGLECPACGEYELIEG